MPLASGAHCRHSRERTGRTCRGTFRNGGNRFRFWSLWSQGRRFRGRCRGTCCIRISLCCCGDGDCLALFGFWQAYLCLRRGHRNLGSRDDRRRSCRPGYRRGGLRSLRHGGLQGFAADFCRLWFRLLLLRTSHRLLHGALTLLHSILRHLSLGAFELLFACLALRRSQTFWSRRGNDLPARRRDTFFEKSRIRNCRGRRRFLFHRLSKLQFLRRQGLVEGRRQLTVPHALRNRRRDERGCQSGSGGCRPTRGSFQSQLPQLLILKHRCGSCRGAGFGQTGCPFNIRKLEGRRRYSLQSGTRFQLKSRLGFFCQ